MQQNTELITLPAKENALKVFTTVGGLEYLVNEVRSKVSGTVYDINTKKGRDDCASDAYKVARSKAALDRFGKALSAEYKEIPKKIDAERKRAFDELESIQKEVRKPLTDWEEAEKARKLELEAWIDSLRRDPITVNQCSAEEIGTALGAIESIIIDAEWLGEYEVEARRVRDNTLSLLRTALTDRKQYEAEQAELARLRAEAEARAKQDEIDRIAREASERATREAEQKAQQERDAAAKREADARAAQELAEQQRLEAIEREKQAEARAKAEKLAADQRAKDAAEAARLAEIERQRLEQERLALEQRQREADREHRKRINRSALDAFIAGGMPEACAKQAVTLIAQGVIPAIKIEY